MSARGAMCGPQAQTDAAVGAFPCVHAPTLPRDAMPPVCGAVSSTGCPPHPREEGPTACPPHPRRRRAAQALGAGREAPCVC